MIRYSAAPPSSRNSAEGHTRGCRYGNALVFINEMTGLTLTRVDPDTGARSEAAGEELLAGENLDNGLSVGENIAVLVGILVGLRVLALIGLKLAHRRGWL